MIAGTLIIEDCMLTFCVEGGDCTYTVQNQLSGQETRTVSAVSFTKALAIAVHWEGEPDFIKDYHEAESVQPLSSALRWIP